MGRVRGTVRDTDGNPIDKVTITIEFQGEMTQKFTATTNAKGEYVHIAIRIPGPYRITPSKEGYTPVEYGYIDVQIKPSDRPVVADFKMQTVQKAAAAQTGAPVEQQAATNAQDAARAVALLDAGKINEAVEALKKVIEADPNNASMHYNLGVAYERRDEYEKARKEYDEAIRLKEDFGEAYLAIGNSFMVQKKFSDATESLSRAVELMPANYTAAYNLGVCYSNNGRYAEAESAYKKASAISPSEPVVHYQLGMALLGQSKNVEAKAAFMKYLELNPNAADKAEVLELLKSL
jgi:Flp pilus assembly protein TadD